MNSNADECESNRRGKGKPVNAIALFALFSLGAVLIVFTVRIFIHANSIHSWFQSKVEELIMEKGWN